MLKLLGGMYSILWVLKISLKLLRAWLYGWGPSWKTGCIFWIGPVPGMKLFMWSCSGVIFTKRAYTDRLWKYRYRHLFLCYNIILKTHVFLLLQLQEVMFFFAIILLSKLMYNFTAASTRSHFGSRNPRKWPRWISQHNSHCPHGCLKNFHPSKWAGVFIWDFFSPACWGLGGSHQDTAKWASPRTNINRTRL